MSIHKTASGRCYIDFPRGANSANDFKRFLSTRYRFAENEDYTLLYPIATFRVFPRNITAKLDNWVEAAIIWKLST